MKLLTKKELAELLRCDEKTISYYVSSRQIPFLMIGKETRFNESRINEWVTKREVQPTDRLLEGI